jgi:hypothetical protein
MSDTNLEGGVVIDPTAVVNEADGGVDSPITASGPQGRAFVLTIPLNGYLLYGRSRPRCRCCDSNPGPRS